MLSPERNECSNLLTTNFRPLFSCAPRKWPRIFGEFFRRSVLERIYRLLLVADREHRARDAARAGAGGEFGGQPAHDLPLLVAGVLRLIDQNVIDAEVELVVHPGGVDVGQKRQRLVDQIVVIEQPAALLFLGVAGQHLVGDGEQRRTAVAAGDGAVTFE